MAPIFTGRSVATLSVPLALALAAAAAAVASGAEPNEAARAPATARFLRAGPLAELDTDVQRALSQALGAGFRVRGERLLAAQASLEPTWRTMPKDARGRINHRSLRYMVQRYFRQKYHLSIIGLEPLQVNSTSSVAEAKLLAELTPSFVRGLLEGASAEAGFSLEDMAALVSVIERLVEDAGHEQLEASYKARGFDVTDLLTRDQLLDVMKHYLLHWIFGLDMKFISEVEENRTRHELFMNRVVWKTRLDLIQGHILAFEQHHQQAGATGERTEPARRRFGTLCGLSSPLRTCRL